MPCQYRCMLWDISNTAPNDTEMETGILDDQKESPFFLTQEIRPV